MAELATSYHPNALLHNTPELSRTSPCYALRSVRNSVLKSVRGYSTIAELPHTATAKDASLSCPQIWEELPLFVFKPSVRSYPSIAAHSFCYGPPCHVLQVWKKFPRETWRYGITYTFIRIFFETWEDY
eukprot:scaffold65606_cov23-Tisochrysis_lutea.AAC.4